MNANHLYIRDALKAETITINARLHWIGYAAGMLLPFVGWLGTYYVPAIAGHPAAKWVMLGSLFASMALLFLSHVEQATSEIVVTGSRVIGSVGDAMSRHAFELSLAKIKGVKVAQSPLGRILGYGTLTLDTGDRDSTIVIRDVDKPQVMQSALIDCIRDHQAAAGGTVAA